MTSVKEPPRLSISERTRSRPKVGTVQVMRVLSNILKYGALILFSCFFVLPWVWMISTSLKSPQELSVYPPVWIPNPIRWDNYVTAFQQASLYQRQV